MAVLRCGIFLAVLLAICGAIECQITSSSSNLNSTHPLTTEAFGISYPTNASLSNPEILVASVYFNVSDATFVDTSAVLMIRSDEVYKTNSSFTSATSGTIVGSFGTIVPPCHPANRSESYFYSSQFNATTNAVSGEALYSFGWVSVPTLVNDSTIEVKCRVPYVNKCIDYYSLTIIAEPAVTYVTLDVESSDNITLHFYNKKNNAKCESFPFFIVTHPSETVGLPALNDTLDFWLGIEATDEAITASQVKLTWRRWDAERPSAQSPSGDTPHSGDLIAEIPRWALALLIVFGVVVVVLIIVVIVMCVKRNKRVNYSTI